MENHHVQCESPLSMAIFNSYIQLPEGNESNGNGIMDNQLMDNDSDMNDE